MWYYAYNEQAVGPVDAGQIQGLIAGGYITHGTYVWREGMLQWVEARLSELAGLFSPAAVARPIPAGAVSLPVSGAPPAISPSKYVFKNFTTLTRTNQVLLVISILLTVFGAATSVWAIMHGAKISDVDEYYALMPLAYSLVCFFAGLTHILVYMISIVCFSCWLYRACANVHALGTHHFSISAGKAVGVLFIPILNLYRPYRAMRDIWKASISPLNWINEEESDLVTLWWAFAITSGIAGRFYFVSGRKLS